MRMRQKQMRVEPSNWYKVEKIIDSVEYNPGDLLKKSTVESLCHSDEWKVSIVPVKS